MDWGKAKRFYVTHPEKSYADVAKKFGCCVSEVKRHGKIDNWVQERADYRQRTDQKTLEKMSEVESYDIATRKKDYIDLAKIAMEKVLAAIQICEPEDKDGLRKMVASVKDLQQILMLPTEEEAGTGEVTVTIMSENPNAKEWGS